MKMKGMHCTMLQDVCCKLRTIIERENHKLKEEMILCLMDLVKHENPHACGADEEWTNLVDMGGLWYVKSTTYQLFCGIECIKCPFEALTAFQG